MIYGTAWKKEATATLVAAAITNGFRAIDTASQPKHYNEKLVGDGIAKALKKLDIKREDLFIQTKFTPVDGQDPNNIPYDSKDNLEKQVCDSLEVSLKNLQVNYIDSLVLHSPLFPVRDTMRIWKVFESFVEDGLVKQIGISNCYDPKLFRYLYDEATVKPAVLQNRFYEQTDYDKELREFCQNKGIVYQSFWSLSANPHLISSKIIGDLSKRYGVSCELVFYRFLTQIGITPLNGTTSIAHMQEDMKLEDFTLEESELDQINQLL